MARSLRGFDELDVIYPEAELGLTEELKSTAIAVSGTLVMASSAELVLTDPNHAGPILKHLSEVRKADEISKIDMGDDGMLIVPFEKLDQASYASAVDTEPHRVRRQIEKFEEGFLEDKLIVVDGSKTNTQASSEISLPYLYLVHKMKSVISPKVLLISKGLDVGPGLMSREVDAVLRVDRNGNLSGSSEGPTRRGEKAFRRESF